MSLEVSMSDLAKAIVGLTEVLTALGDQQAAKQPEPEKPKQTRRSKKKEEPAKEKVAEKEEETPNPDPDPDEAPGIDIVEMRSHLTKYSKVMEKADILAAIEECAGTKKLADVDPKHFSRILDRLKQLKDEAAEEDDF